MVVVITSTGAVTKRVFAFDRAIDPGLCEWAGAFLNRQGYYTAAIETAKPHMTADEWGYRMEGKACAEPIKSPTGEVLAQPGETRDGGSFWDRMGKVSVWNTVMDEDRYMVRKWNEFVAA